MRTDTPMPAPVFEPLTVFTYQRGMLSTGGVGIADVAEQYGTPLFVYNMDDILNRYHRFMEAFRRAKQKYNFTNAHTVHFAVKANSNQAVLSALGKCGCGMDVVSGGELKRALAAGVPADKIIFSGVAKSDWELQYALQQGVLQINVESLAELHQLQAVAENIDVVAPIGLRMNPNVAGATHAKISTGKNTDKFGIDADIVLQVSTDILSLSHIDCQSISVHIGSQLMCAAPFVASYKKLADVATRLIAQGLPLKRLDLGGGLGVCYAPNGDTPPDIIEYAQMVIQTVAHVGLDIHFEPGRWLVGNAGALIGTVENIKVNDAKTFVLTDIAMNDFIRPTLYEAYHHVVPVQHSATTMIADVVGPVCESGDYMAKNREIGTVKRGDYIAVLSTGAYGMVLASNYNTRPTPAEVAIYKGKAHIIRRRQTITDIIHMDTVPDIFV